MRPVEFWDSTLHEVGVFLKGAAARQRDLLDVVTIAAWKNALFRRQERLPDLETVLSMKPRKPPAEVAGVTLEEEKAKWQAFFRRTEVMRT